MIDPERTPGRLQSERDEAVKLLERVLFLRQNGPRPPGAPHDDPEAETWPPLVRDVEAFLRRSRGMLEP